MKKLIYIFFFCTVCIACTENENMKQLVYIDSLVSEVNKEAADKELSAVDTSNLSNSEKAYYTLLNVQKKYCFFEPLNDSTVLNPCIKYYTKSGDKEKLARALYYKGEILYAMGEVAIALGLEKQAEHIVNKQNLCNRDNLILYQKICEGIAFINLNNGENEMALKYSKLSLECLDKMKNRDIKTFTLGMISAAFENTGQIDSAIAYTKRCIPIVEYTQDDTKNYVYSIICRLYIGKDNAKASTYLAKALQYPADALTYTTAAKFYMELHDYKKAEEYYKLALHSRTNNETLLETQKGLASLYEKNGNNPKCINYYKQYIATKDSLQKKINNMAIDIVQYDSDNNDYLNEATMFFLKMGLCVGLSILLYFMIQRIRLNKLNRLIEEKSTTLKNIEEELSRKSNEINKLTETVNKNEDHIRNSKESIRKLKTETRRNEKIILKLTESVNTIKHDTAMDITTGKRLLDSILRQKRSVVKWTDRDFEKCMDYCKVEYPAIVCSINQRFPFISTQNCLILFLKEIGLENDKIGNIFGVKGDSIRRNISRIKKRAE